MDRGLRLCTKTSCHPANPGVEPIERRDKLNPRGFTNEIHFSSSLVNPPVTNLSRRSIPTLNSRKNLPPVGLEPTISSLGGRRLIH